MKAIVVKETSGPANIKYEDVDRPIPGANEVLVRVKYAALNRRDLFITYGLYPGINMPAILGADGSGEVAAVGEGVSDITEGDAVVIYPSLNWGENQAFHHREHNIVGMPTDGTFAEYVTVPAKNIFKKPDYLDWEEAAAVPLAGVTAYRALMYRGKLQEGETVLIPGIGSGVALYALQIAVAHGANVYVTSSSEEKLKQAKALGAKGGVNYRNENWVKEMMGLMNGADLIIDGVGGDNFNSMINLAKPGGRIVNFGATAGAIKDFILPRVFFKQIDIRGTTMGSPQDFKEMLSFFEKHEIIPHIDRSYKLEETAEALRYMENGENFGKITLRIED